MKADAIVRLEAIDALIDKLGEVDAERFVQMIKKENFDYTRWRDSLWPGKSVDEIHEQAIAYEQTGGGK
ncbi:MAG: hypothetical protein LBU64_00635 [Planctomycetota bacterium]|jgi:hypothetical protein|nr:hypothetical protein [Planctomycetota bacterium]